MLGAAFLASRSSQGMLRFTGCLSLKGITVLSKYNEKYSAYVKQMTSGRH